MYNEKCKQTKFTPQRNVERKVYRDKVAQYILLKTYKNAIVCYEKCKQTEFTPQRQSI